MASIHVHIPASTAARITHESILAPLHADAGFTARDGAHWTAGALAGGTPLLTLHTNTTLGSVHLNST
jgi:hypothetical protein